MSKLSARELEKDRDTNCSKIYIYIYIPVRKSSPRDSLDERRLPIHALANFPTRKNRASKRLILSDKGVLLNRRTVINGWMDGRIAG